MALFFGACIAQKCRNKCPLSAAFGLLNSTNTKAAGVGVRGCTSDRFEVPVENLHMRKGDSGHTNQHREMRLTSLVFEGCLEGCDASVCQLNSQVTASTANMKTFKRPLGQKRWTPMCLSWELLTHNRPLKNEHNIKTQKRTNTAQERHRKWK